MVRFSRIIGLAAATALSPLLSALAAPCTTTTAALSTYLAGGVNATCTVLDKTFSGMTATNTAVNNIFVNPKTDQPNNPGLFFDTPHAGINITFTVTAPSNAPITGASLQVSAEGTNGIVTASETLSNGKSLEIFGTPSIFNPPPPPITFPATTSLTVTLFGNGNIEQALVNNITVRFAETPIAAVPEPASLTLLAGGLFGLLFVRRRRAVGA